VKNESIDKKKKIMGKEEEVCRSSENAWIKDLLLHKQAESSVAKLNKDFTGIEDWFRR